MQGAYRVNRILRADGVRDEEPDQLDRAEASVANSVQDSRDIVRRERYEVWRGRLRVVRPAREETELRRAIAVRHADRACELDAIIVEASAMRV